MCQLCTCVLQGKMYWESKSVRGKGSHASIFLNSQDPLEYSSPICSSIQTDVWAGMAYKSIKPSYILRIQYLLENQMSCRLRAVWDMLAVWGMWIKSYINIYKLYTSVYLFISQDTMQELEQFSTYFCIFFQLPPPLSKNGTLTGLDFICQSFFMSPANDLSV